MFGVILGIHILVCASLIVVVLLQSGKGGGLAGAFGGAGGVGAVFGGQAAATFLTKATRYLAIAFMLTSIAMALAIRGLHGSGILANELQSRQPGAATTAGEIVPQEGGQQALPGNLPGGAGESQPGEETQQPQQPQDTQAQPNEQVPVVPEGQ